MIKFEMLRFKRYQPSVFLTLLAALVVNTPTAVFAQNTAEVAKTTAARQSYNISAQPLVDALIQFGQQSGLQISTEDAVIKGKQSSGVQGNITIQQAVDSLLAGTGLKYQISGGMLTVIRPTDGVMMLSPIKVAGASIEESAYGPVIGYVAKKSATGTKTDASIIETPQAISVITEEQVVKQGAQNPSQALRYTPGVVAELYGSDARYDWVRVRGFAVDEYLDGMALPKGDFAWPRLEMFAIERSEVLRGPASVLYGTTPPGGLYNFVSKKPSKISSGEVQFQVGDPDREQVAVDMTGPLSDKVQYRLTGLMRKADTHVNHVENDRQFIQPSITFQPSDDTSVTLMAYYYDDDSKSIQFLPALGVLGRNPNGDIPRDTFVGEPGYDDFNRIQKGVSIDLQHDFRNGWSLSHKSRQAEVDVSQKGFSTYSGTWVDVAPNDGVPDDFRTIDRLGFVFLDKAEAFTSDTSLLGSFEANGLAHTLLMGLDYRDTVNDYQRELGFGAPLNLYEPVYGNASLFPVPPYAIDTEQELNQVGVYVQDQIKFGQTTLIMSARHDWADTDVKNRLTNTKTEIQDEDASYRMGLIYNFDNGIAPYISYSTSFEPNTASDQYGNPLDPTKGEQVEVGLKYQSPDESQLITLSLYEINQTDAALAAPGGGYSEQVGEVTVKGAELEVKAEITDGLNLIASASITDTEITDDNNALFIGKQLPTIPKKNASLWVDYTLPVNVVNGLGLGLGVRYVDSHFGDKANTLEIPSYTLMDAALYYDLPMLKGTRLSINATNLTDKKFVASCDSSCYWGESRTILATLSYKW